MRNELITALDEKCSLFFENMRKIQKLAIKVPTTKCHAIKKV
jgi:hypothetical protein